MEHRPDHPPRGELWLEFCSGCGSLLQMLPPCVCGACGREFWDNPRACAGAFVTFERRLLLVQRSRDPWRGCWDIPGGFCEGDEHPEAAAVREVREETGLDIQIESLLGMWIDRYGAGDTPSTLNVYYLAAADRPHSAVVADDENEAIRWFSAAELVDLPLAFPGHLKLALDTWIARSPRGGSNP